MRPLIFLLAAVLLLGITALATAGDCPGGVCPIESKSIVNVTSATVEVMAVGIVFDRQPVRNIVKRAEAKRPIRNLIDRFKNRNRRPLRKLLLR